MSPDPGGEKVVKLDDPQTWNMYAYVRNNPTTFTDPTGLELKIDPDLLDWVNEMRAQSSSFDAEIEAHQGADKPDLAITTGNTPPDIGGGPTAGMTVPNINGGFQTCNPNCVTGDYHYHGATVTINDSISADKSQTQDVLAHEVGHVHDARTNTNQYEKDSQDTKRTNGRTTHDKRPEEMRANQFKDMVKAERKEWKKEQKEQLHCRSASGATLCQ